MKYTLLKRIIELVETYEQDNKSARIEDFTIWLNTQLFSSKDSGQQVIESDLLIAFKLMYISKELKKQSKSIFLNSKVSTIDEYSFLLHLNMDISFRKMELIEMHNLEAPTGIEIIKRLLKNKLIEEFPDEHDKRAKRIQITRLGLEEINHIEPRINVVFTKISNPLDLNEKIQLSGILNKLIH